MPEQLPDVVILGAQKAGTTSLSAWLTQHPQCWVAPEKEVHFFDIHFGKGVAWYRSRFAPAPPGRLRCEATPYYLFHPRCPARIAATLPSAKFIVMLRDPVDRAISSYFHAVQHGREPLPLEAALEAESERLAHDAARMHTDPHAYGEHHQWNSYQARGRYTEQLDRYFALLPRSQFHIAFLEDLIRDPGATLAGIAAFLGIEARAVALPKVNVGDYRVDDVSSAVQTRLHRVFDEPNAALAALLDRALPWPRETSRHSTTRYDAAMAAEVSDDAGGVRQLGHRAFIGGDGAYWDLIGELQFNFLVAQGLRPDHVLLDVACGSLRGGTRFIRYLDPKHYLGFDKSIDLVILGVAAELGTAAFLERAPEFVINSRFDLSEFTRQPDVALAQSLFTHLTPEHCRAALAGVASIAKSSTRFFVSYFPADRAAETNPEQSHSRLIFRYTTDELATFGAAAGWKMRDLGSWNHPRGQLMALFTRA
ncbi:MAG: sulfotransferase [Phycisphaerae bacterium]|nr:sulfotransferase [Phycisphaerae bacterium]